MLVYGAYFWIDCALLYSLRSSGWRVFFKMRLLMTLISWVCMLINAVILLQPQLPVGRAKRRPISLTLLPLLTGVWGYQSSQSELLFQKYIEQVIRRALWSWVMDFPIRCKVQVLMATAASPAPLVAISISHVLKSGHLGTGESLVFMGHYSITLHFWMSKYPMANWFQGKWKGFNLVWLTINWRYF